MMNGMYGQMGCPPYIASRRAVINGDLHYWLLDALESCHQSVTSRTKRQSAGKWRRSTDDIVQREGEAKFPTYQGLKKKQSFKEKSFKFQLVFIFYF